MAATRMVNLPALNRNREQRVLIAAPAGAVADAIIRVLQGEGVEPAVCASTDELCRHIKSGVAAAIVAEELLTPDAQRSLSETLQGQPDWSTFPLLIVAATDDGEHLGWRLLKDLNGCAHVTVLQRPIEGDRLQRCVRTAVQFSTKQYEARDDQFQRKRAEHALRESEERYRRLVGLLPVAVYSCEAPSGMITFYNAHAAELWGRHPKIGDTDERFCGSLRLFLPDGTQLPHDKTPMAVALREGLNIRNSDVIIERPDGTRVSVLVNIDPVRDEGDRVVGAINVFHDITAMKRAQQELADYFENASVGLHWVGADGTILRANQAELDMLGYRREEYVGHHIAEFHVDQPLIDDILARLARGETVRDCPARMRHKDGSVRDVLINSSALFDGDNLIHTRCFTLDVTEGRRTERALRESEERFARFMLHLPGLSWIKGVDGRYLYVNDAAADAFGTSPERLYGKNDDEVFPPETAAAFKRNDREALASPSGTKVVEELEQPDGRIHYSIVNKFPIPGPDGQPSLIGGMAIDITELKQAEAALRASEERYRSLTQATTSIVWITDAAGRFVEPQPSWTDYTGQSWEEHQGFGWSDALHPEDREQVHGLWEAARAAKAFYQSEGRLWHAGSGSYRHFEARAVPILNADGSVREWIGTCRDVENRKQADDALRESEERLRLALNAGRMGSWEWSIATNEVAWSPGLEAIHGIAPGSFGGTLEDVQREVHPDDRELVQFRIANALEGGGQLQMEYRIIWPDETIHWVEGRGMVFRNESGQPVRMVGVCADITERKLAEEALRESERTQRLLAEISMLGTQTGHVEGKNIDDVVRSIAGRVSRELNVSRCGLARVDLDAGQIIVEHDVCNDLPPLRGPFAIADFAPRALKEGARIRTTVINDVATDPRTADRYDAVYRPINMRAYIYVPLHPEGRWVGGFWVSDHEPRQWSPGDVQLMEIIAQRAWLVVERSRLAAALRESEVRYRAIVEGQAEMVCRFRPDGTILFVNGAYARARGMTPESLTGVNFWDFVAQEDRPAVRALLDRLRPDSPEVSIENRFETRDGVRWTLWTNHGLTFDDDGKPTEVQSSGIDITDRKRTEEALRESERRLSTLVSNLPGMAYRCRNDEHWTVEFISDGVAQITGHAAEDFISGRVHRGQLQHPDDLPAVREAVQQAVRERRPYQVEYRIRHRDGSLRWVWEQGEAVFENGETPVALEGFIADITDRKRHDEQMRSVMAELNHRVKNTLATIDAIAQQTLESAVDLQQFRTSFCARLRSMAAAHSLLTRTEWQGAELRDILRAELMGRVPSSDHLVLSGPAVRIPPKAALALHMAIHELTTNASKYGSLAVPDGRVEISWDVINGGGEQKLDVVWKEQDGPPVVEPSTCSFGSLLICDVIEYELSGKVERRFEPDGLRCRITFPLASVDAACDAAGHSRSGQQNGRPSIRNGNRPRRSSAVLPRLRILLVEDNYSLARQLAQDLESAGCTVTGPASTLAKGSRLAQTTRFDAALLDVDLNGTKVYPLARELKGKRIPFALLTGFNRNDLPPDLEGETVLSKPVEFETVRRWLEGMASGAPSRSAEQPTDSSTNRSPAPPMPP